MPQPSQSANRNRWFPEASFLQGLLKILVRSCVCKCRPASARFWEVPWAHPWGPGSPGDRLPLPFKSCPAVVPSPRTPCPSADTAMLVKVCNPHWWPCQLLRISSYLRPREATLGSNAQPGGWQSLESKIPTRPPEPTACIPPRASEMLTRGAARPAPRPRPLTHTGSPGPAGHRSTWLAGSGPWSCPPPAGASFPLSSAPSSASSLGPSSPPGTALGTAPGPRTPLLPESQGETAN